MALTQRAFNNELAVKYWFNDSTPRTKELSNHLVPNNFTENLHGRISWFDGIRVMEESMI